MRWHYVEGGKRRGPVSDEELAELFKQEKISDQTPVWSAGMEEWITYGASRSAGKSGDDLAKERPDGTIDADGNVACVECGKKVSVGEALHYFGLYVCTDCKPAFLQKLAEGADLQPISSLKYASISLRAGAYLIDFVILVVVDLIFSALLGAMEFYLAQRWVFVPGGMTLALGIMIRCAYETLFVGTFGATIGKMICRIKIVTATGGRVGFSEAFRRYLAKLLSGVFCCLGYLVAVNDAQKRTFHDRVCNTRVVMS